MENAKGGLEADKMKKLLNINNEKELVKRILGGQRWAFEGFYKKHKPGLKRYCQIKVGDARDVEELIQDSFLSFLDSLPLFRFKSSLKTFLYSIARHEVMDYYRRKYAKRALKLVPIVGELVDEKLFLTDELSGQIDKVYKSLSGEYSRIIILKYEEGMSVKQIAGKLKLSMKAVESKLFRARRAFQKECIELKMMS